MEDPYMKLVSQVMISTALSVTLFAAGGALAGAQTSDQSTTPPADNTKMNQRDRNANEATADQQKANRSDRDITQQIRKSIVSDKSLSTYGHNVGADKVTNEIDVQPKQ
jgi:hypothetical protein